MPKATIPEIVIPELEEAIQLKSTITPEIGAAIAKYYKKIPLPKILDGINAHFNTNITFSQLSHYVYDKLRHQDEYRE